MKAAIEKTASLLLPVMLMLIWSCTGNEHSAFKNIDTGGWLYDNPLEFFGQSADSLPAGCSDLALVVRHTNNYGYQNLWIEVSYTSAGSVLTDTMNVLLADDFGSWLGKGTGVSFQRVDTVLHNIDIDLTSPVKVRHIMRVDTLREIEQIGVIVKSVKF